LARIRGLSIAALNGPEHTVVSGPSAAVAELSKLLEAQGTKTNR